MTVFVLLLGGLTVWAIVASIVVVSRDGYRRQPTRLNSSLDRDALDQAPTESRPTDLIASQWLQDSRPAGTQQVRQQGHSAGAMVLRPW